MVIKQVVDVVIIVVITSTLFLLAKRFILDDLEESFANKMPGVEKGAPEVQAIREIVVNPVVTCYVLTENGAFSCVNLRE